jgi:hypothetical protein
MRQRRLARLNIGRFGYLGIDSINSTALDAFLSSLFTLLCISLKRIGPFLLLRSRDALDRLLAVVIVIKEFIHDFPETQPTQFREPADAIAVRFDLHAFLLKRNVGKVRVKQWLLRFAAFDIHVESVVKVEHHEHDAANVYFARDGFNILGEEETSGEYFPFTHD